MKIFNYNPTTFEYVDTSDAFESPLEPGVFLVPASATEVAPPSFDPATQQCYWTDGAWTVSPIKIGAAPDQPTAAEIAAAAWATYQEQAKNLLGKSDITLLRCFENGVQLPSVWTTYRKALRAIVGAQTGDPTQPLPSAPSFPPGT